MAEKAPWPQSENSGTSLALMQLVTQIDQASLRDRASAARDVLSDPSTGARCLMMGGLYTSADPTLTNNQVGALRLTADGKLMVAATLAGAKIEVGNLEVQVEAIPDDPGEKGDSLTIFGSTNPATYNSLGNNNVVPIKVSATGVLAVDASGGTTSLPVSGSVNVAAGPTKTALGAAQVVKTITVIAKLTNASNIVIGDTNAQSCIMEPGRDIQLTNVDIAAVFINGTAGEGVTWIATK